MAKKSTTKKAVRKSGVNKTAEVKKLLVAEPDMKPKGIAAALTARGIETTPGYVSSIKTKLKAEVEEGATSKLATKKEAAPEQEAVKAKGTTKKRTGKKKVTRKKQTPAAAPSTDFTYTQLTMAKEMAQQLGGVAKAKEALAALSNLMK